MNDGVRFGKNQVSGGTVRGTEVNRQHEEPAKTAVDPQPHEGAGTLFGGMQQGAPIDGTVLGRKALGGDGELRVLGAKIARAAPAIRVPRALENGIATLLGGVFANRGPLSDGAKIEDHRSAAAAQAAIARPPVAPGSPLGPLTIFRPGLGNTAPGPAQIARLAQHTDKLIIAYANPGEGAERQLRPVTEVDGVPLPPEVRGKVFAIGSPQNLMITFEQASDLSLEQLESMRRSPHLAGVDLAHAKATVIAHSQGGLDMLLTRKRLVEAGLGDTIGTLATLATPYRGSPVSGEGMAGLLTEIAERGFDLQSMAAVNALDPDHVKKVIGDGDQHHVDLALIGQTESGRDGRKDIRTFFKVSDAAIEAARSLASLFQGRDVRENDGLVTVSSQKFGAAQLVLQKSYDHAGIAEDPAVIDRLIEQLTRAAA